MIEIYNTTSPDCFGCHYITSGEVEPCNMCRRAHPGNSGDFYKTETDWQYDRAKMKLCGAAPTRTAADHHAEICDGLKELYRRKNADYGNSFATARQEVPQYTLGKLYDKFNRYKHIALTGEQSVSDETIEDTLLDLANYAIMEVAERRTEK